MYHTGLIILGGVAVVMIVAGFIGYATITHNIIRSQEREIANLRRQLHREKSLHKEPLYIEEPFYIIQDGKNPKFGGF